MKEEKFVGIVYFILNKLTGKYYVGKSRQKEGRRWRQHQSEARTGRKTYFCKALRKYGQSNFETRTIFTCYDLETLNAAEVYFISFFESFNPKR